MLDISENEKRYKEFIDKIKEDMVNISGIPTATFETVDPNTWYVGKYNTGNNPCEHCPNNPKNNPYSSGVCHCVLPSLYNPIY
jgi:hypothetical protein